MFKSLKKSDMIKNKLHSKCLSLFVKKKKPRIQSKINLALNVYTLKQKTTSDSIKNKPRSKCLTLF